MCEYVKIYKIQRKNVQTFCAKILHISTDKNVQHVFVLIWANRAGGHNSPTQSYIHISQALPQYYTSGSGTVLS